MNSKHQKGFSIVELMVALVAGLLLLTGVIQVFVTNKQTYRVAEANARIQENARFSMEALGRYLRVSGYRSDASQDMATAFPALTVFGYSFNSGEVIRGGDHEVVVRYQGGGTVRDCEDNSIVAAGTTVTTRVYREGNELKCSTNVDSSGSTPLLSDMDDMVVLYGVDTNNDRTANQYVPANQVSDWSQVVSVRINLLLRSAENNIATAPQTYTFNGTTTTPSDRYLRHTYTTTIALRNALP